MEQASESNQLELHSTSSTKAQSHHSEVTAIVQYYLKLLLANHEIDQQAESLDSIVDSHVSRYYLEHQLGSSASYEQIIDVEYHQRQKAAIEVEESLLQTKQIEAAALNRSSQDLDFIDFAKGLALSAEPIFEGYFVARIMD